MYTTDSTDAQWQIIEKFLDYNKRKRKNDLRTILDAIFYLLVTGCQWRNLPKDFPKWQLVYYYFSKWRDEELFVYINDMLVEKTRIESDKSAQCSLVIIDSQSVKTTRVGGLRGYDGNKKIKGRKRHVVVDSLGNIVSNIVHPANIHDSVGAKLTIKNLFENTFGIKYMYADCGYRGKLIDNVKQDYDLLLNISPKIKDHVVNKVSPKRWLIERTFSWFENFRRLSKDFEYLLESSQAMIYIASIKLLLNKI
jgi:transposase